jgi:hypothetical protein
MDDQVAFGTARTLLHDVRFSAGDMADRSSDDLRGIQGRPLEKQGAHLTEALTELMAPGQTGSLFVLQKNSNKMDNGLICFSKNETIWIENG